MMDLQEILSRLKTEEASPANAIARLCQEIVLVGIARSPMKEYVTIKGGVVMRSISEDSRRATIDMDIDFIRYSLDDAMIRKFIEKINCVDGIKILVTGKIEELKQQDYRGKRVHISITDDEGHIYNSKIDFGVHKYLEIEQDEYCFGVCVDEEGAVLLVNSREQMFVEKLKSLLKFGTYSTRYKDVYDMCYLTDGIGKEKLHACLRIYIFNDSSMRENNMNDIRERLSFIFRDKTYCERLNDSQKNWLGITQQEAFDKIMKVFDCEMNS